MDEHLYLLLPSGLGSINPVENFHLSKLPERFVKASPFVNFGSAQQKRHAAGKSVIQEDAEFFERCLNRNRTPGDGIRQEVDVLKPDQLLSSEERQRLNRLDRQSQPRYSLVGVLCCTVNDINTEVAGVLGR